MSINYANTGNITDIVAAAEAEVTKAVDAILAGCLPVVDTDSPLSFGEPVFVPSKIAGDAGRYLAVMLETVEMRNGETRTFKTIDEGRSFSKASDARAACPSIWPDVRIPEGQRIESGVRRALAAFLGATRRIVKAERQITRAFELVDTDGVGINEALELIQSTDKAVVTNEREDGPVDAPKPVTVSDDESMFE